MKIILVDDKLVYRNAIKTLLQKLGDVEIIAEASNGVEFLKLLDDCDPDLVFIDIEMPIPLCKLMPFDSEAKKGSRVSTAEKDGKKVRKLKTSGKII